MTQEHTLMVRLQHDLHARPSVRFTQLARSFDSKIEFRLNHSAAWVDASSIVKVMRAKLVEGTEMTIRATGKDGSTAVCALADMLGTEIDEANIHVRSA